MLNLTSKCLKRQHDVVFRLTHSHPCVILSLCLRDWIQHGHQIAMVDSTEAISFSTWFLCTWTKSWLIFGVAVSFITCNLSPLQNHLTGISFFFTRTWKKGDNTLSCTFHVTCYFCLFYIFHYFEVQILPIIKVSHAGFERFLDTRELMAACKGNQGDVLTDHPRCYQHLKRKHKFLWAFWFGAQSFRGLSEF